MLPESSFSWHSALAVVALGVLGTGAAYVLAAANVGRLGSTRASVSTYLIPVGRARARRRAPRRGCRRAGDRRLARRPARRVPHEPIAATTGSLRGGRCRRSLSRVTCRRSAAGQAIRACCPDDDLRARHQHADGEPSSLAEYEGHPVLLVNVASRCGLTPQYTGLEQLQQTYGAKGFSVLGFPCNQFGGQEPGSAEEIQTFCSTSYGVTFPMFEKIEVNGPGRHPIYAELTDVADAEGHSGDIRWNFEKFLIGPDGTVTRFGPQVAPDDPQLVDAIEAAVGQADGE